MLDTVGYADHIQARLEWPDGELEQIVSLPMEDAGRILQLEDRDDIEYWAWSRGPADCLVYRMVIIHPHRPI